jgi:hypothetical protein
MVKGGTMTPKRDNAIRQRAQEAYAFAVAELARTDSPSIDYGAGDYDEQRARRDAWENTPGLREYRSWLYNVQHIADYRRRHPVVRLLRRSRNIGRVGSGEYGEPTARFHWHWQNLDGDLRRLDRNPTFLGLPFPDIRHEGRAWFDWYVNPYKSLKPLKIEVDWAFGKAVWSSGFSYSRKNSGTITLHAALRPVASVYLIFKHLWPRTEHQPSRTYSISVVAGAIHYDFGKPGSGDEWHRDDPLNWMRGIVHPLDKLFGRDEHHKEEVGPKVHAIASFPEGDYPLLLQREVRTWKRPRWPFTLTHRYVDIEAVRAAESQGKGENSWDCGPDAIWGMSSPGHSYEDAVAAYVKATLRDRRKRGHISNEHRSVLSNAETPA